MCDADDEGMACDGAEMPVDGQIGDQANADGTAMDDGVGDLCDADDDGMALRMVLTTAR